MRVQLSMSSLFLVFSRSLAVDFFQYNSGSGCTVTSNCISSPNYPANYNTYDTCSISVLASTTLDVIFFELELNYDYLYVAGTGYSGLYTSNGPVGVAVTAGDLITFSSDYSVEYSGFYICATSGRPSETPTHSPFPLPTQLPYPNPTQVPSFAPSQPTQIPTPAPTLLPTLVPTSAPSRPTQVPTPAPTAVPTLKPSPLPTLVPSPSPTVYCIPGEYLDSSRICTPCPAGQFSNNITAPFPTSCHRCGEGKYTSNPGATSCINCPVGKISTNGRSSCANCDGGKYVNSTGNSACFNCDAGRYSKDEGAALCSDCPSGKMQKNDGQTFCYVCLNPDWCVDATTCLHGHKGNGCSVCAGYRYFDEWDEECKKCPKNSGYILLGASLLGVLLCIVAYSISGLGAHDSDRQTNSSDSNDDNDADSDDDDVSAREEIRTKKLDKSDHESEMVETDIARPVEGAGELPLKSNNNGANNNATKTSADTSSREGKYLSQSITKSFSLINMSINHLQISMVYFSINVKYPDFFVNFLNWFSVLMSFDFVKLAGPECSTGSLSFFDRWLISIMMPLCLLLPFLYMSLRGRGFYRCIRDFIDRRNGLLVVESKVSPQSRSRALIALILLTNALYIFEVERMISAVRCKKEGDPEERPQFPPWKKDGNGNPLIMIDAPQIACSNRNNDDGNPTYNVILFLSCTLLVVLSFGVSFGTLVLTKLNPRLRKKLQLDLRDGYIWWGSFVNIFKLSVVLVGALLPFRPGVQNWIMMLLSLFMGLLVLLIRPHEVPFSTKLDRESIQQKHELGDLFDELDLSSFDNIRSFLTFTVMFKLQEEWDQLVLTGDGNNIGEAVFFFLQFILLSFQRLGYFGLLSLNVLGASLLIIYCISLLWTAYLSRAILGNNGRAFCDLLFSPLVIAAKTLTRLLQKVVTVVGDLHEYCSDDMFATGSSGGSISVIASNAKRFAHEANEDVVVADNIELGDVFGEKGDAYY